MIVLNHTTRFGNSFNLLFFQHVLLKEYGLVSNYVNGRNFAQYFEAELGALYCRDVSLPDIERLCIDDEGHFTEQNIHNLTNDTENNYRSAKFGDIEIFSTMSNVTLELCDLFRSKNVFLNRAHYFHLENIVDLRKKHQDTFRKLLQFKEDSTSSINSEVINLIEKDRHVRKIGIHLRLTDYKDYLGGKYYFSVDRYKDFIDNFKKNFDQDVVFYIFTDDKEATKGLSSDYIKVISGTQKEDFCTMTKMDLLVGPPSSFSSAASFIEKVPRHILRDSVGFDSASNPNSLLNKKWYPHIA